MEFVANLTTFQALLVAVGASFLLNLVVLGLFLGRNDRQTLRLMTASRQDREALYRDLAKEVVRLKEAQLSEYSEIRRSLARIEIRRTTEQVMRTTPESRTGLEKKSRVYRLANQGLDSRRIAEQLKMPPGETELVLGLRQFQGGQS